MRLCLRSIERVKIFPRECAAGALGGVKEGFSKRFVRAGALVGYVSDSVYSSGMTLDSGVSGLISRTDPVITLAAGIRIEEGSGVLLRGKMYRAVRVQKEKHYTFARLGAIV